MFVDPQRWETDPQYREACDAEMLSMLKTRRDRAEATFGTLRDALDARGLTTQVLHTGGGTYNLAIALAPVVEGQDGEGWQILVGEPEQGDAGNILWEASIADDEGPLDAIALTLNQLPGESVEGPADQLARLALRLTTTSQPE